MRQLVESTPDITLEEIRETLGLRMKKSQISSILRNKLGFRFKKDGTRQRTETKQCKSPP